jgi:Protein of unknown function (DUF1566)
MRLRPRCGRPRVSGGLLIALLVPWCVTAEAASRRRVCRDSCGDQVAACEATTAGFGKLSRGCAKAVWKECARAGTTTCQVTTTTVTTTTTSTTTTTPDGAQSGSVLQTGQSTCWNSGGATIPCSGSGQDGEARRGVGRAYVDNGDGTITDTTTGLVWEKLSDDGSIHDKDTFFDWADIFTTKLAGLNSARFAGHADWRVPNVAELRSLADYGTADPAVSTAFDAACAPGCTVLGCSCTRSGSYWSSSTDPTTTDRAWIVDFYSGGVSAEAKASGGVGLRAVRGGP